MKARLISVLLVLALLVTVGVITAQAAHKDDPTYMNKLNGVYGTAKDMSFTADVTVDAGVVCPYCGTAQAWTALPAATGSKLASGHYYVPVGGLSNTTDYYLADTADYCIHLNDQTVTSTGIVFRTSTGSGVEVRLMGKGIVTTAATDKPAIQYACGIVQLMGGTYKPAEGSTYPVIADQGVVAGTASVYGTKRLMVANGTDVQGTIECWKASAYMVGGHIKKAVLGTSTAAVGTTSVATQNGYIGNYFTQDAYGIPEIGGAVVIDELDVSAETARTLSVKWLTTGASITVSGVNEITDKLYATTAVDKTDASANAALPYFHAANEATHEIVVKGDETNGYYLASQLKDGVATCAVCGEIAVVQTVGGTHAGGALAAGHYKLTADLELAAPLTVAADVCVDLGEYDVISAGRVLEQTGGTVKIDGTGTVTGKATAGNGATVLVAGGNLYLNGGTYKHADSTLPTFYIAQNTDDTSLKGEVWAAEGVTITADRALTAEGAIDTENTVFGQNVYLAGGGRFNLDGGIIENGTYEAAANYVGGANVYVASSGILRVNSGSIEDGIVVKNSGSATGGGNIYINGGHAYVSGGTISGGQAAGLQGGNVLMRMGRYSMTGGTVTGGSASEGGNICIRNNTVEFKITGGTVSNGVATAEGGNLAYNGSSSAKEAALAGADFIGGTAPEGGNVSVTSSYASVIKIYNLTDFIGGTATTGNGGCLLVKGETTTVELISARMSEGVADQNGALVFVEAGRVNVHGGTYTAGTVGSSGACMYLRDGELMLAGGTFNSDSSVEVGNAVYVGQTGTKTPKLILGETATSAWEDPLVINDPAAEKAIALNKSDAALEVDATHANDVYVYFKASTCVDAANRVVNGTNTGAWTGHVYVSSMTGNPEIYPETYDDTPAATEENPTPETVTTQGLKVAEAAAVSGDTTTWYKNAEDAFATDADSYLLNISGKEVEIEKDTTIELNGKSITVNGSGVVTATNSKATAASELTLNGPTLAQTETAVWADDHFDVVLGENGEYTIHRLEMRIKSISLRPTTAGLYYTSEIVMDSVLKNQVDEIGVVLAVGDGNVDLSDPASENVKFVGTKEIGSTVNSVLVNNILKVGAENNADRAGWKVQGAAAVIFKGDLGEAVATAENFAQSRSVNDYMDLANSKFAGLSDDNKQGLQDFYNTWKSEAGWSYADIESWVAPTPEA